MTNALSELLETRDWLLADGATGTNLFNMGLVAGEAPEAWNLDAPQKIKTLYSNCVNAGSDIFLTNSFGGTSSRLKLHDLQTRVHEVNRIAAELGREVADAAGRKVVVAGSMGPTGEIMGVAGTLAHEDAVEMFAEQAQGLMDGGADVLWIETISAPEEFIAAAEAIESIGAPWCGTMSFDTAGRTMMGVTSVNMVEMVNDMPQTPVAFGANCGVGSSDLLRTVLGMSGTGVETPLIAKGNAGIPKFVEGHIHYDGTPELMADYAVMARNAGARIIGGCCGTMPEHLEAMRAALEAGDKGPAPSHEDIVAALGGFSSPQDGTEADAPSGDRPRRGGRRRR